MGLLNVAMYMMIFIVAVQILLPALGVRKKYHFIITLALAPVFVFSLPLLVPGVFDGPMITLEDLVVTPTSDEANAVTANCTYFKDTGSKTYLETMYGDDPFCEIRENSPSYMVECYMGNIQQDSDCEQVNVWRDKYE